MKKTTNEKTETVLLTCLALIYKVGKPTALLIYRFGGAVAIIVVIQMLLGGYNRGHEVMACEKDECRTIATFKVQNDCEKFAQDKQGAEQGLQYKCGDDGSFILRMRFYNGGVK